MVKVYPPPGHGVVLSQFSLMLRFAVCKHLSLDKCMRPLEPHIQTKAEKAGKETEAIIYITNQQLKKKGDIIWRCSITSSGCKTKCRNSTTKLRDWRDRAHFIGHTRDTRNIKNVAEHHFFFLLSAPDQLSQE